jgi:hypothetical protein
VPLLFDVDDTGAPDPDVPRIQPWRVVPLDPDYGGLWFTAGDVDGDGEVEIITAENYNENDNHYTSAVAAQKLDGSLLWTWGDPEKGRKTWHHDVACQVQDWDNDGALEVVVAAERAVAVLDGKTGGEKHRFAIPEHASDCIVFCNLDGGNRPADILVKTRYTQIWAYDYLGNLRWTVKLPGGRRTAHQPRPMDIDNDGRDEIFAGYAMLNPDGSVRWVYESKTVNEKRGHLDCARILRKGKTPEEMRIVLTCCGANNLACIDGNGKILWEQPGCHYESISIGNVLPDAEGPHIVVDIDHVPENESPLMFFDRNGILQGRIMTNYCRHHRLLDWTGDALMEVVAGGNQAIYNQQGQRIGTCDLSGVEHRDWNLKSTSVLLADMTGNGVPDIVFITPYHVFIFRNEKGEKPDGGHQPGAGANVTLY